MADTNLNANSSVVPKMEESNYRDTPGNAEIERLVEFARHLPERFPSIVDADGQPAPADVEFGFLDGRLRLFQIRPFLNSAAARGSDYLSRLDRELETTSDRRVDLDERPLH